MTDPTEHEELDQMASTGPEGTGRPWLTVLLLVSPYLLALAVDLGCNRVSLRARIAANGTQEGAGRAPLSAPWGDLIRLSGAPRVAALFPPEHLRRRVVQLDAEGFRDPRPVDVPVDVTIVGSSFLDAGTTFDDTLAGQIQRLTGLRARNLSVPGSPTKAMKYALELTPAPSERTVVWGLVQRELVAGSLVELGVKSDSNTGLVAVASSSLKRVNREARHLREALENAVTLTAPSRQLAREVAWLVPPVALDPGLNGPVLLTRWRGRPTLFYKPAVQSVFLSMEERDAPRVMDVVTHVQAALAIRGQRLLVVLIPDKYQLARAECEPTLDAGRSASAIAPTTAFAEGLRSRGVFVLDLLPALATAQSRPGAPPLFRCDDTHWADEGVLVAAEAIAPHLRE